jgi:hypothetical protein
MRKLLNTTPLRHAFQLPKRHARHVGQSPRVRYRTIHYLPLHTQWDGLSQQGFVIRRDGLVLTVERR